MRDLFARPTGLKQPAVDELDVTHRFDSLSNVIEQSSCKVYQIWGMGTVDW